MILWFNPCSAPGWDGEENWVRESVGTCELIQRQFTKQGKSFPCKQSETRNSFPVSHQQAGVPGKLRSSYIMVSKEDSNHNYKYLHFSFFARKLLSTAPCGMGCTLVVVVSCPDCVIPAPRGQCNREVLDSVQALFSSSQMSVLSTLFPS